MQIRNYKSYDIHLMISGLVDSHRSIQIRLMNIVIMISLFQDSRIVIDRYKSGLQPPGDIPFEDLSCTSTPENHIQSNTPRGSLRTETLKGTVSGGKLKKRTGLFGIFGHSKVGLWLMMYGDSYFLLQGWDI